MNKLFEEYDGLIIKAVRNHNKFKIEAYDYMTKLNGYFSNILYNEKNNPNGLKIEYPIKLKAYKEKCPPLQASTQKVKK